AVKANGEALTALVGRYENSVHGYLNRCAHVPIELDWNEGDFFESSGLYLMCATHGAIYTHDKGKCVGGPWRGSSLRKEAEEENDNHVFSRPHDYV
ncbi:Rieske 2Fe-2S domain-containing protein, partial [Glaciimonas sp. Cout2]|uniref:Rieske (2Fe-2S) protein n=1 Tax=Glaciimonas sp. Cout2 TaxID=3048621 RepID=UPI002B230609